MLYSLITLLNSQGPHRFQLVGIISTLARWLLSVVSDFSHVFLLNSIVEGR